MVITGVFHLRLDHLCLDERRARLDLRVIGHIGLVDEIVLALRRGILARGGRGLVHLDGVGDPLTDLPGDLRDGAGDDVRNISDMSCARGSQFLN